MAKTPFKMKGWSPFTQKVKPKKVEPNFRYESLFKTPTPPMEGAPGFEKSKEGLLYPKKIKMEIEKK